MEKTTKLPIARKILICVVIVSVGIFMLYHFVQWANYTETSAGDLVEIDNGIYIQMQSVYSNVPANNKNVAVVCIDNQIRRVEGKINIFLTEDKPSYSLSRKPHMANADELTVYVPKGGIQQLESSYSP